MATTTEAVTHSFTISEEERAELIRLLERALGESRGESHKTHTPEFRDRVLREQSLLHGLLERFSHLRIDE
ncbi:MAG: hypothetical protein ACLP7Q_07550 [Isosphaeraceae bacterium]|nr:hypothetical protein [Isosphaeraceae bacterium]